MRHASIAIGKRKRISPTRATVESSSGTPPQHAENPKTGKHRHHSVGPGHLPAHLRISHKLPEHCNVVCVFPGRLDFSDGIRNFGAKQEIRAFWQLVTEVRIDPVNNLSRSSQTGLHQGRRKKGAYNVNPDQYADKQNPVPTRPENELVGFIKRVVDNWIEGSSEILHSPVRPVYGRTGESKTASGSWNLQIKIFFHIQSFFSYVHSNFPCSRHAEICGMAYLPLLVLSPAAHRHAVMSV
jgi:hypothetical protein